MPGEQSKTSNIVNFDNKKDIFEEPKKMQSRITTKVKTSNLFQKNTKNINNSLKPQIKQDNSISI